MRDARRPPILRRPAEDTPLVDRLELFDRRLRSDLTALAELLGRPPEALGAHRHYFSITLLSDVVVSGSATLAPPRSLGEVFDDVLCRALGKELAGSIGLERVHGVFGLGEQGGWDALKHRPKPLDPTLTAASSTVLARPSGRSSMPPPASADRSHPSPLHQLRLCIDAPALARSARVQRLPRDLPDLGYLLHGHLAALFGKLAPKPFRARPWQGTSGSRARGVEILAYTSSDTDALHSAARRHARTEDLPALDTLSALPLLGPWPVGTSFGFEVRACPVVRLASASALGKAGAEVDAYLSARERASDDPPPSREQVYRRWLEQHLAPAATCDHLEPIRPRSTRLFRRTQGRHRR